jgi:ABC-type phosphate transport system auxiliary subunit
MRQVSREEFELWKQQNPDALVLTPGVSDRQSPYRAAVHFEQSGPVYWLADDEPSPIAKQSQQIASLQKQVIRACEIRQKADERASRRGVHILNARIERLETELTKLWHRASGVERKRLEAENSELRAKVEKLSRELRSWLFDGDEEDYGSDE